MTASQCTSRGKKPARRVTSKVFPGSAVARGARQHRHRVGAARSGRGHAPRLRRVQDGEEDHRRTISLVVNERGHQIFVPGVIGSRSCRTICKTSACSPAAGSRSCSSATRSKAACGFRATVASISTRWRSPRHTRTSIRSSPSTSASISRSSAAWPPLSPAVRRHSDGHRVSAAVWLVRVGDAARRDLPVGHPAVRVSFQGGYLCPKRRPRRIYEGFVVQASVDLAPF